MKRVIKKQEIWKEKEKVTKLEGKAKKLVPPRFYKWIHIFRKKASERMPTRKMWDYIIDMKKEFVLRKGKVYPLSREEREEVCEFIDKQLRKEYIRSFKLP